MMRTQPNIISIFFLSLVTIGISACSTSVNESAPSILTTAATPTIATPSTAAYTPPGGIPLAGAYTSSSYLTLMPFGTISQWIQPWRSALQTQPASVFINGAGVNLNSGGSLTVQMLGKYGIGRARLEVGWGNLDYSTGMTLSNAGQLLPILQQMKAQHIRPVILLNANSGLPCPNLMFTHTVTANAAAGATTLQLDSVSSIVTGYSGLNDLTDYWEAQALVTAINGNTVTLSQPLPNAIASGTVVQMGTLKYRPLASPNSVAYNATDLSNTLTGWSNYVSVVSQFVANALGTTTNSADAGFDLEIWNELGFDSYFLFSNQYYGSAQPSDEQTVLTDLEQATVTGAASYKGVLITDGFADTSPFPGSSEEVTGVNSLSKHPYPPGNQYPAAQENMQVLNASLQIENTATFTPNYFSLFIEYPGTALQTETIMRDMSSITTNIYGVNHGENARVVNGVVSPVTVSMTETGINPAGAGINDVNTALIFKAKYLLRAYSFYLNKGLTQVDLYNTYGTDTGDTDFGIALQSFLTYDGANTVYPANDSAYVSPALKALGNMIAQMKNGLDTTLTASSTRALTVKQIWDTHNHSQFTGDGTAAHPNLYDREVLAFLPYQVNAHRFVIPYYVMTRNELVNLTPENFTIDFTGINAVGAAITAYDPLNGVSIPLTINQAASNEANVTLPAADYPYLLMVQEAQ